MREKVFVSRNSYLNQQTADPNVTSEPVLQSRALQSFFEKKREEVVPDMGFRSLLENPSVSPTNFKKRKANLNDLIILKN
jgi:hypothetical protein